MLFYFCQFQWVTGDPVSFQMWLNNDFGQNYTSNFTESRALLFTNYTLVNTFSAINFSKIILHTLYPKISTKQKCTMMLLANRAYPQWITIECERINQQINIICMKYQTSFSQKMDTNGASCPYNYILKGKFCYDFIFFKGKTWTKINILISEKYLTFDSIKIFNFLFIATNVKLKSFLSINYTDKTFIKQFSYDKYFSIITYKVENVLVRHLRRILCKENKLHPRKSKNCFWQCFFL